MTEREFDAIVVGAGLAGLAAARRLATDGMKVALVEKCDRLGGSSAMSGGWFALSETPLQRRAGIADSDALFYADMIASGGGYADPALLNALVHRQEHAVAAIDEAAAWTDEIKVSAGMTVARAHLVRIGQLMSCLERDATAAGVTMLLGAPAEALIADDTRVRGIRLRGEPVAASSGVILTTGGFSRSRELLDLFVPGQAGAMPYGGVGNTGDGLRMAWMLGAGLADVGHVSGTYGQHADTTDQEHELLTADYLGAILVNARGERFADESASYKSLGSAVLGQPGGMAIQLFDSVVRARSRPGVPLSDMERLEELGHLISAPTIEELADALDVPPDSLSRTVERYNSGLEAGVDQFGRTGLVNGVGALVPIARPPFYAYPAVTAMTSTYGGLRVAADTTVRRVDGSQIAGLRAAGEVTGGFHGASYMTGTALTKALVFGVEAADSVMRG